MEASPGLRLFVPRKQRREIVDFLDSEHTEVLDGFLEPRDFAWEPLCGHYTIYNIDALRVADEKEAVLQREPFLEEDALRFSAQGVVEVEGDRIY